MLEVECSCGANEGGCICASEFRWFWNLQCAHNVTMRMEDGCGKPVFWRMVAGNISNERVMADVSGTCGAGGEVLCESGLDRYLWSTRLVEVQITMPPVCTTKIPSL